MRNNLNKDIKLAIRLIGERNARKSPYRVVAWLIEQGHCGSHLLSEVCEHLNINVPELPTKDGHAGRVYR